MEWWAAWRGANNDGSARERPHRGDSARREPGCPFPNDKASALPKARYSRRLLLRAQRVADAQLLDGSLDMRADRR